MSADLSSSCVFDPSCELGMHSRDEHPCGRKIDKPGEKCRPCADDGVDRTVPESGQCVCWTSVDDIPFATLKGLFAGIDLSLDKRQR